MNTIDENTNAQGTPALKEDFATKSQTSDISTSPASNNFPENNPSSGNPPAQNIIINNYYIINNNTSPANIPSDNAPSAGHSSDNTLTIAGSDKSDNKAAATDANAADNKASATDANAADNSAAAKKSENALKPRGLLGGAQSVLNKSNKLIDAGNKLIDKGEKYIKKLRAIRGVVSVFMWISVVIFAITTLICGISIYKTVSSVNHPTIEINR